MVTPLCFLFLSWTHTIIWCCGWLSTKSNYSTTFAGGSRELLVSNCVPLLFFVNYSCEVHIGSSLLWHEHKRQAPHWLPINGHRNCSALLQLCATLSSCPAGLLCAYRQFMCPTFEKHPCYCTARIVGLPSCGVGERKVAAKEQRRCWIKGCAEPSGIDP